MVLPPIKHNSEIMNCGGEELRKKLEEEEEEKRRSRRRSRGSRLGGGVMETERQR